MDQKKDLSAALSGLFGGLLDAARADNDDVIKDAREAALRLDADRFDFHLLRPVRQMVEGTIQSITRDERAQFILAHKDFIDSHLCRLFQTIEGSACSADKAGTVIRRLLDHFINGTPIVFDDKAKYTYHLPKTILNNEADCLAFFEGLYSLYYGNPERYLLQLQGIYAKRSAKE